MDDLQTYDYTSKKMIMNHMTELPTILLQYFLLDQAALKEKLYDYIE